MSTRWNSTFKMFERFLELKDVLLSTMAIIEHDFPKISQNDWKIIEGTCKILEIFEPITEEIRSEKSVNISKIIPLTKIMRNYLTNITNDIENLMPTEGISITMIKIILKGISNRFSVAEETPLLTESTLLDPKYKKRGFESETSFQSAYSSVSRMASQIRFGVQTTTEQ